MSTPNEIKARLNPISVTTLLLGTALVAWVVSAKRMHGMDAGPGTDLGDVGWFLGVWVTMMAAMMLPSAAPMVLTFARVSRHGGAAHVPTWIFVAGYGLAWTGYGLLAYGGYRLIAGFESGWLAWEEAGRWVAGGAIAAAGIYQLTPLKETCLRHCRTPMHFVLHGWKKGKLGALRMGFEHGLYCVGCCAGLMLVLFALGAMSVFWMAVVAGVIFLEKVTSLGLRLSRAFAFALIVLGFWIGASPDSVPGLAQPTQAPGTE